jgi:EmrB/QacA subfamily drug resistance transporter
MNAQNTATPMYAQQLPKKQVFWMMAGVMLAMLLGALDQTIVGTAMPRIVADLGGFSLYTWVTSIYMITSAVVIPIVGKLTDTYGRKIFYIIGVAIFAGASLGCGLSQSMTQLIIFRGIQGIGGGVLMTNAFTVIADLFPPDKRGKYQGLLSAVYSFASVIGPTTGGYLTDSVSWHWVFFINIPLSAIVIFVFMKFFPGFQRDNIKHPIDYAGLTALVLMVGSAMLALSWGGVNYTWGSPVIIGLFAFAAVMFGVFLFVESKAREPIVPLYLFKSRIVSVANAVSFMMGMGMFGCIVFVPLYLQGVLGYSATASGNMQIPQSIAVMISSLIVGQVISRRIGKFRLMSIIAMGLICIGIFLLSRLTTSSPYWYVIIDICIMGFGMGITLPLLTLAIQNNVPYKVLGVATSSNNFIRSFGGAVGLAVLGAVMNNRFFSVFMNSIPENVKNAVPLDQLTALARNPNALVNAGAQEQLQQILNQPTLDPGTYGRVMDILKESLNLAITQAFFVGSCVVLLGVAVAFLMKDKSPMEASAAQRSGPSDAPPPL